MTTLTVAPTTSSLFSEVFKPKTKTYTNKVADFIKDKNTKANALLAYWGAETIIDALLSVSLFLSGAYILSFLAFALAAYRTYAILGVLSDVRY